MSYCFKINILAEIYQKMRYVYCKIAKIEPQPLAAGGSAELQATPLHSKEEVILLSNIWKTSYKPLCTETNNVGIGI